ncbi:hypothetical protein C8R43DRAFT_1106649 [Mycena crocata]|nr:hypothetical protein C8R43DRAFT_1106649 [Mycena crocata]
MTNVASCSYTSTIAARILPPLPFSGPTITYPSPLLILQPLDPPGQGRQRSAHNSNLVLPTFASFGHRISASSRRRVTRCLTTTSLTNIGNIRLDPVQHHDSRPAGETSCLQGHNAGAAPRNFGGVFTFLPTGYMLSSRDRDASINPQSPHAPAARSAAAEISIQPLTFRRTKLRAHVSMLLPSQFLFNFWRSREQGYAMQCRPAKSDYIFRVPASGVARSWMQIRFFVFPRTGL